MSAQPDLKALAALANKLVELDAAMQEFIQSGEQIGPQFESYARAMKNRASYGVISTKGQACALYDILKPFPGIFSTFAARAQRVTDLSRELNEIVFQQYLATDE